MLYVFVKEINPYQQWQHSDPHRDNCLHIEQDDRCEIKEKNHIFNCLTVLQRLNYQLQRLKYLFWWCRFENATYFSSMQEFKR